MLSHHQTPDTIPDPSILSVFHSSFQFILQQSNFRELNVKLEPHTETQRGFLIAQVQLRYADRIPLYEFMGDMKDIKSSYELYD